MNCSRFRMELERRISQQCWQWQQLKVRFRMRGKDHLRQDLESSARNAQCGWAVKPVEKIKLFFQ